MIEEDNRNRLQLLFDFYGRLLKDKQRQYFEMYYHEDLSLSEIAELQNVSRQAVFDQVKRVERQIEQYEEKLKLLARYEKRRLLLDELKQEMNKDNSRARELVDEISALELDID
ncbi:YlxM family DNA-binding protein [Aneurinibacillus sp. Ricciae_BoGa-3]|uniref:YlxM family DNA-binding protein n=1 Tax=Aneurinibacillus sp. Ricciae_BoGa-3 TaxID=3022697 RepID=UPI002341DFA2|nr:YlxM family DNA-binding protein [Aneurinibacillus sp. Ricciae_BoGa-3]WCK53007.1 YlxM family DNA-binding protein [Aneurinibacillus sp. Ricciae_BoGa-3]